MTAKRVTLFGATGTAGGAVLRHMLAAGWNVRAVTRDAASPKARAVTDLGAEVVVADLDDRSSIRRVIEGSDAVYLSGPSLLNRWDIGQAVQGINVADAAAEVSTRHLIFQSATVGDARGILGMGSKRAIEERIAELSVPYTISRPGLFMDNFLTYYPIQEEDGELSVACALQPDVVHDLISGEDIGRAAVAIASDPERHAGQTYGLVAEPMSYADMVRILSESIGRPIKAISFPVEALEEGWPQGAGMFRWMNQRPPVADSSVLRQLVGEPIGFRQWADEHIAPRFARNNGLVDAESRSG